MWKKLVEDSYSGHAYKVFKASFRTPCLGKVRFYWGLGFRVRLLEYVWAFVLRGSLCACKQFEGQRPHALPATCGRGGGQGGWGSVCV